MNIFILSVVLLCLLAGGTKAQVVQPSSLSVLQNSAAKFNCSVSGSGWNIMTWLLQGKLAATISESAGSLNPSGGRFSVTNYSTPGQAKWEFSINNVTIADSGQVACQLLNGVPQTATLSVQASGTVAILGSNRTVTVGDQVLFQCLAAGWLPAAQLSWTINGSLLNTTLYNTTTTSAGNVSNSFSTLNLTASSNISVACLASIPALSTPLSSSVYLTALNRKPVDYTVLIAIVVAFTLAALLALLIILIVFCCKRRKRRKSRYEHEARAHTQVRRSQGQDNLGYVAERHREDPNQVFAISGLRQPNYTPNSIQLPAVARYNQDGYSSNYSNYDLNDYEVHKHRHATIV